MGCWRQRVTRSVARYSSGWIVRELNGYGASSTGTDRRDDHVSPVEVADAGRGTDHFEPAIAALKQMASAGQREFPRPAESQVMTQ
jgi:hypothetical protein